MAARTLEEIEEQGPARLASFQGELGGASPLLLFRKWILNGSSLLLPPADYHELKQAVAVSFNVHPSEVVMVGSAKLGFSLKPARRYELFANKSDIDVAIVSPDRFVSIWRDIFLATTRSSWTHEEFNSYLFRGWLRPDKFPRSEPPSVCRDWNNRVRDLTASRRFGPYDITIGMYHSWPFMERYQIMAIEDCQRIKEEAAL
jgi:hypothetical protein